jgi:hypothetical protein
MSQYRRIAGQWPAKDLNEVSNNLVDVLSRNIPMEAEYKAGKEVQIQLAKAVAKENNRGSIAAAQKAGRATAAQKAGRAAAARSKTTGPGPGPGSLDLLALRLVKKTRKRKAVEDVEEVDLGPRRLRSKK